MSRLAKAFSLSKVQRLAGPLPYARGAQYYRDGRVEPADSDGTGVHARVRGTMPYTVRLWMDGGRRAWSCTCPAAEDGSFCKHCVAVAFTLDPVAARSTPMSPMPARNSKTSPRPERELSDFVGLLPKSRLVEIVLEQAESDWRLRERLLAEDRAVRGVAPDQGDWRRRLDRVFTPYDGFVTYREAAGWADGIYEVIAALEDMCEAGHPDTVVTLTEYAYRCADKAVGYVDDSDGQLYDISERLAGLHHRACSEGGPDPAELASGLVELDLDSTLEGFYSPAVRYAAILGEVGLAAYRECLNRRRAELEDRRDQGRGSDYALSRIDDVQVDWTIGVGDPDVLIDTITEVRKRVYASDAMEIIKLLMSAGREDEAVDWAKRGLRENRGPWGHASDLRDFLAGVLRERGDTSGAVDLYWDAFRWDPSLLAYRRLVQEAGGEADVDTDWLRSCIEELRGRLVPQDVDAKTAGHGAAPRFARALLDILLYEGRVDEAWDTAKDFGCDQQMWLTLARAREQTHPLDAIGVYQPEVWAQIKAMKNPAYEKAVDLMDRIRRLADAVDEPHRFTDLLDQVRTEHWRKRNLKKLLDGRGWDEGGEARARSAPAKVHLARLPKRPK